MALRERKLLREARQRLRDINFQIMGLELEQALARKEIDEPDYLNNLERLENERNNQLEVLDKYESLYLIRKAQSWGIEVPHKREWYTVEIKNPDPDSIPGETIAEFRDWLNEVGKAVITKKIRDERFAYWKGWAELLVPILSFSRFNNCTP